MIDRRTLLAAPLAFACGRPRAAGYPGFAFVANEDGHAIAAVDLSSFTVARHIGIAARPTAVLADPDQSRVHVLAPAAGMIFEVAADTLQVTRKVTVASVAIAMRRAPDGDALWILSRDPRQLMRLRLSDFAIDARIPMGAGAVDFDLARRGSLAAVSYGDRGAVELIDLERARSARWIQLDKPAGPARFQSDGRQLLVASGADASLVILAVPSGQVVTHLPLALRPRYLCFKSDGGQLFITGDGVDAVAIIYPYQTQVAETVLAGHTPGFMATSTTGDHDYLFVANERSGDVTILDLPTHRVIAAVRVGREPAHISITPEHQYALVLNRASGDMAVIRIAAIRATRTKSAPLFTMIPVGSRPVSAAIV